MARQQIGSPYPKSLTKEETLKAFERAGYTYLWGEMKGGATLVGHTKIGYPIYEVTFLNDMGEWEKGKAFGEYRDQQFRLEF